VVAILLVERLGDRAPAWRLCRDGSRSSICRRGGRSLIRTLTSSSGRTAHVVLRQSASKACFASNCSPSSPHSLTRPWRPRSIAEAQQPASGTRRPALGQAEDTCSLATVHSGHAQKSHCRRPCIHRVPTLAIGALFAFGDSRKRSAYRHWASKNPPSRTQPLYSQIGAGTTRLVARAGQDDDANVRYRHAPA